MEPIMTVNDAITTEYRSLLEVIGQDPGPDDDGWSYALKTVRPDFTTHNGFTWWQPGQEWIDDGEPFNPDVCEPGGLHVGYTAQALQSGNARLTDVVLLIRFREDEAAPTVTNGTDAGKRKVKRCQVVRPVELLRRNLTGADLTGADLTGANLYRAYLRGAYLSWADLSGAYLSGADLSGANLRGADLSGANLRGAYLSGANLSGAYLTEANLNGAYLNGANLTRADLTGANLRGANLRGANLTEAYLSGAYLTGAYLTGAYLSGADLTGAYLTGADLTRANLTEADLTGVVWDDDTVWPDGYIPNSGKVEQ